MTVEQTNLLQGTLDMMILKSLATGEMHGLGISRRIEQITRGTFQVKPGSLFPPCTAWRRKDGSRRRGASRKTTAARSITG